MVNKVLINPGGRAGRWERGHPGRRESLRDRNKRRGPPVRRRAARGGRIVRVPPVLSGRRQRGKFHRVRDRGRGHFRGLRLHHRGGQRGEIVVGPCRGRREGRRPC